MKSENKRKMDWRRFAITSMAVIFIMGLLFNQSPQKTLSADLLTPTNSALPFMCSSVSTASSNNAGGNSPGNLNYGISLWYGVGSVTPYSHLGPTGNELGTLSDSNVFEQRYVGTSSAVLAVGASDAIGEQVLTVTCDTGTIQIYTASLSPVGTNMRLYVAKDGSTYHSRADHDYSTWPEPPDLSPEQALRPEHLAKASPTYQPDCYNTGQVTYGEWVCDGTGGRKRMKTVSGQSYNAATNTCSTNSSDTTWETESCSSSLVCSSGICGAPIYTVDDDFNTSTEGFGAYQFNSIQTAVDIIPEGSTLKINAGLYMGNVTLNKTIMLEGAAASQVILDGGGNNTVLTIQGGSGAFSGLTIRNSGQTSTIPGNAGIHINPSSTTTGNFTIKDNVIYGNGNGIVLSNGLNAKATIQNNMIFRNLYSGLNNVGFGQTSITNNTISDNGVNGYIDAVGKGPHTFKNNLVVNNGEFGFLSHKDSKPRTISYNNLWNNGMGNYVESSNGSYTYFTPSPATGELSVDPLFNNRSNADYSLSSNSPLKGKGENGVNIGSTLTIGATNLPALTIASDSTSTESGLIGHWKFDGNGKNEMNGSPAAFIVGNASFKTDGGKYGGYAYIPGKTDWLKIPYHNMFDLPTNFTIEFWFRQRSNQSHLQNLIYKGYPTNNYNFMIFRQLWNQYNFGPIITGFTSSESSYWAQTSNPNELKHNEWHHVVYTKSPSDVAYYLDGVWTHGWKTGEYSPFDYADPAKTPAADIIIGDSAVDTDIDNLRIYNRGMNQAEVRLKGGFPEEVIASMTVSDTATVISTGSYATSGTSSLSSGTYATGTTSSMLSSGTYANGTSVYSSGTYATNTGSSLYSSGTYASTEVTGTSLYSSGTYATPNGTSSVGSSAAYGEQTTNSTSNTIAAQTPYDTTNFSNENNFYSTGTYASGTDSNGFYGTNESHESEEFTDFTTDFTSEFTEAPSLLTRSLTASEDTLASFESFIYSLDSSQTPQNTLDQAYDLIDQATFYIQQIRRSLSEGNSAHANRRLGLLQGVMEEIRDHWELLATSQNVEVPIETFFNNETILKEELSSHGMEQIAEQIVQLIIGKINFAEIVNQIVKQSSETLNQLFAYSDKHGETVSKTMDVLVIVDEKFHDDYLENKTKVLEVVDRFDEKIALFESQNIIETQLLAQIETLKEKIIGYNFIGSTGDALKTDLEMLIERLSTSNLTEDELEDEIENLDATAEMAMENAREEKFEQGAIPFKDTDDHEWFTQYVVPIQHDSIISGYKDAEGNSLGSFGPSNNVTIAEILKIALEASELGQGDPNQVGLEAFNDHWALGYVAKGKSLGLTLLKGIDTVDELNQSATRAEVVRLLLEVFQVTIDFDQTTQFADSQGHKDEAYIEKVRELEIVNGYSDGTFRPDHFVNRAEAAKIVNLLMTNL